MKALEQNNSTEASFIIHDNEKTTTAQSLEGRTKDRILEHVKNGTDVILVTSAKHATQPVSLERYFSDSAEEIRTICLNSNSFDSQSSEHPIDLSMISAIVYESIHLDTHFAIIVDNADQFPIEPLNELVKLALGINTSKNNVNFIFSGGPNLLGVIEQISDIRRLSLVHCSLDVITEEDIQEFIDIKQNHISDSSKLQFNKYALRKICTLANGSLHNTSVILEWVRQYALHTDKLKITVGFLDELIHLLKSTNLLSNYPPQDYQFSSDIKSDGQTDKENVEFVSHETSLNKPQPTAAESKTIYIETIDNKNAGVTPASNVYEKVMINTTQSDVETNSSNQKDYEKQIETAEVSFTVSNDDLEYTDTYQIEALKHINDPFPYADEDLPLSTTKAPMQPANDTTNHRPDKKSLVYVVILALIVLAGYFAWSNQLINHAYIKSLIPDKINLGDLNPVTKKAPSEFENDILEKSKNIYPKENITIGQESSNTIDELVKLAHQQIADKKLTTPPEDNAFDTFKLILEFQPNNKAALAGIDKIKTRYQTWAQLDINEGKIKRAKYFLSRAIEISPNDKEVKQLLSSLD